MDGIKFQIQADENHLAIGLSISGKLIIDNSQYIHKEFVGVAERIGKSVTITIENVVDFDLTFIQLFVAFIQRMDELKVHYQVFWNLNDDQKTLLENVGLGNEILLNN